MGACSEERISLTGPSTGAHGGCKHVGRGFWVSRAWGGDGAGEGIGKRQEEQKALVSGSQLGRGSSTGRRAFPGAAQGSMPGGVLKGHRLTLPGPGQGSCPKCVLCLPTYTPKAKPAKAQAISRVASSRVTRRAKPSRALREPDFTRETQRAPFQPELLSLSTKQRVMPKDPWGQG